MIRFGRVFNGVGILFGLCGIGGTGGVAADPVCARILVYWQGESANWEGSVEVSKGTLLKWEAYHWENQFEYQLPHRDRWLARGRQKISWESHTAGDSDGVLFSARLDDSEKILVTLNGREIRFTSNDLVTATPRFEGVDGDARVILLSLQRLKERRDLDGDGDPDELIIEETARRARGRSGEFSSPKQAADAPLFPILVRVVDDDDDMAPEDITGDEDSDCWIADWDADGSVDRLVDWIDNDGDSDADEMDIRYFRDGELIWGWFWEDLDDDNRMWSVANYEYREAFASDMYGDNMLWLQKYDPLNDSWLPYSECPFAFYDLDGDGFSEAVVRVSAVPEPENNANSYVEIWGPNPARPIRITNIRYSFDLDNDSTVNNELDYDFGFTLVGSLPYQGFSSTNPLRRPPQTVQRIAHGELRGLADNYPAQLTGFSWDEFDRNHRWEGIFWSESDWVRIPLSNAGGPTHRWNMRREIDFHPRSQRQLYYSETDQRIHCFGASWGWIEHGHMWSEEKIAETRFFDTDGDGFFDRWEVNLDNSGSPERVTTDAQKVHLLPWDYEELHRFYVDLLPRVTADNERVIAVIKSVGLTASDTILPSAVARLEENLDRVVSLEQRRYVTDLLKEYYFHALLVRLDATIAATGQPEQRARLQNIRTNLKRTYGMGYMEGVLTVLAGLENLPKPSKPQTKSLTVRVTNPLDLPRESVPVVLTLDELNRHAPDFGAGPFRVIDAEGRVLPSQVDDSDGDSIKDEIVFPISLGPGETRDISIRYGDLDAQQVYRPRAMALAGQKFHFAWESDLAAYRTYFGKIDFFGKTKPVIFLHEMESPWIDTHVMGSLGMDVLSVGATSGLGGINVWHEGKPYQADSYGAPGEREIRSDPHFRIVANGPVRVLADIAQPHWHIGDREFEAGLRVEAWAGRRECRVGVRIRSTDSQPFNFGPGMTVLGAEGYVDTDRRIVWCWGDQGIDAGNVGLAILYPSESLHGVERGTGEMLVRYNSDGESTVEMVIAGGWTRDRKFRNADEWFAFLKDLRREIDTPLRVEIQESP